MTNKILFEDYEIWITLVPLQTYDSSSNLNVDSSLKICFFSLKEPTIFLLGEMIRYKDETPIFISSFNEAETKVRERLKDIIPPNSLRFYNEGEL